MHELALVVGFRDSLGAVGRHFAGKAANLEGTTRFARY